MSILLRNSSFLYFLTVILIKTFAVFLPDIDVMFTPLYDYTIILAILKPCQYESMRLSEPYQSYNQNYTVD